MCQIWPFDLAVVAVVFVENNDVVESRARPQRIVAWVVQQVLFLLKEAMRTMLLILVQPWLRVGSTALASSC